jgi:hypothetical protein
LLKGIKYYSIIIWKDYNCYGWITLNQDTLLSATPSTFPAVDNAYINQALDQYQLTNPDYNDIWGVADFSLFKLRSSVPPLANSGITYVASQDKNAKYYARVCIKNYFLRQQYTLGTDGDPSNDWGSALLLQMR